MLISPFGKNSKESPKPAETPTKNLHIHDWEMVMKTYASPSQIDGTNIEKDIMEKAMFGVTTLLWECKSCRETKKEECLGSDENTLEQILEKTEKYGTQYIERNNAVFVVGKLQSPQQPQQNSPMIPVK